MAGHSKWANIKHRKGAADKRRGLLFAKLTREILVSSRLGGPDPASNNRLRIAIAKARAANVPNDTIDRAIKKGAGELGGDSYEEVVYEVYAPGGVGLIVEAMTDKKARTTPEIKSILTKNDATLAEANAVTRLFDLKGYISLSADQIDEEGLMELAVEAGADDVRRDGNQFEVLTAPEDFAAVSEAISARELSTEESGIRYLSLDGTSVVIDDAGHAERILKLIDTLDEHDDVQSVVTNMEISAEALQELERD